MRQKAEKTFANSGRAQSRRKATDYIHPIFAPCRLNMQPGVRTNLLEFPFDSTCNIVSLLNSRTLSRGPEVGAVEQIRFGHDADARAETLLAIHLCPASPKTGERMSLRRISAELAKAGYLNERGEPFHAQSIRNMLSGPQPRSVGSPI